MDRYARECAISDSSIYQLRSIHWCISFLFPKGDKMDTVEELQKKILEMEAENEQLKTEKETMSKELDSTKSSLTQARTLNSQLMNRIPSGHNNPTPEPEEKHEETREEFLDSFLEPVVENMRKVYGSDKVGYKH